MSDNKLIIELGSKLSSDFGSAFQSAETRVKALSTELADLKKKQKLVEKFDMDVAAVEKARQKLSEAQQAVMKLRLEAKKDPTANLDKKLEQAQRNAEKLAISLEKQRGKLQGSTTAMKAAGLSTENTTDLYHRFGEEMDQVAQKLKNKNAVVEFSEQHSKKLSSALGLVKTSALAAGAAITGASAYVGSSTADIMALNKELENAERQLGMSSQSLQVWGLGAERVGLSSEKMRDIFKDVSDKLGDLATTGGGEAKDIIERLGLSIDDLINKKPDQAIMDIAKAMEEVSNVSQHDKIFLMEALADEGSALLPLLKNNAQALRDIEEAAQRRGVIITPEEEKILNASNAQLADMKMAMAGLSQEAGLMGAEIMTAFGPSMTAFIDDMIVGVRDFRSDAALMAQVWADSAEKMFAKSEQFAASVSDGLSEIYEGARLTFTYLPVVVRAGYTSIQASGESWGHSAMALWEKFSALTGSVMATITDSGAIAFGALAGAGGKAIGFILNRVSDLVSGFAIIGKIPGMEDFGAKISGLSGRISALADSANATGETVTAAFQSQADSMRLSAQASLESAAAHREAASTAKASASSAIENATAYIKRKEVQHESTEQIREEKAGLNGLTSVLDKATASGKKYTSAAEEKAKKEKKAKEATKASQKAQEEHNKVLDQGKRLTESLFTPQEKYNAALDEYKKLLNQGAISQDTYNRSITKAKKELNDATGVTEKAKKAEEARNKVLEKGKQLTESLRTPQEQYNDTFYEYKKLLDQGAISQDTYNRAITKAKKELNDATGVTEKAKKAEEARNKVLEKGKQLTESLRTPQEQYNDTVVRTPQEQYNAKIKEYKELLDNGHISQETFNRLIAKAREELDGTTSAMQRLRDTADGIGDIMVEGMLSGNWKNAGQQLLGLLDKNFIAPMQKQLSGAISQVLQGGGMGGFSNIISGVQSGGISGALGAGGLGMMFGQAIGQTGIGSGLGAGIGNMILPGIGGLVGGALGSLVESLFGGGPQEIKGRFGSFGSVVQEERSISNDRRDERIFYQSGRSSRAFQRQSAFGQFGILHEGSQSIGRDDQEQIAAVHNMLDGLQQLHNTAASFLSDRDVGRIKDRLNGIVADGLDSSQVIRQQSVEIFKGMGREIRSAFADGSNISNWETEKIVARFKEVALISQQITPAMESLNMTLGKTHDQVLASSIRLTDAIGGVEQANAGLQSVYNNLMTPTQQFSAQFTRARETIISVNKTLGLTGDKMITTRAGLLKYIQGLDLSKAKNAELAAQAIKASEAMGTFAGAIQGIKDMFAGTISNIENDLLTQAEKQKKYMTEAESLFNQLKAESDPGKIAEMSKKINAAVQNAWSNMTAEQKAANADYLKTMLKSSSDIASEQMKGAMSNAEIMEKAAAAARDAMIDNQRAALKQLQAAQESKKAAAAARDAMIGNQHAALKQLQAAQESKRAATQIAEAADSISTAVNRMDTDGSHASGLTSVPFDGYRAILHKKELVATAQESELLRSGLPVMMDAAQNIIPANLGMLTAANDSKKSKPVRLPENVTPLRKRVDAVLKQAQARQQPRSDVHVQGDTITITINQSPGQDPAAVARQVRKELEKHEQAQARQYRARGYD